MGLKDITRFEAREIEYRLEAMTEGKMKIVNLTLDECHER